jgi:hypothetical protein
MLRVQTVQLLSRDVTSSDGLAAVTSYHEVRRFRFYHVISEFRGLIFSRVISRVQTVQLLSRDVTSSDGLAAVTFYREFRGFSFSYVMSRLQNV